MKPFAFSLAVLWTSAAMAQMPELPSHVYDWDALIADPTDTGERRPILVGSTTDLAYLEIHAATLEPGNTLHAGSLHDGIEELIIVKDGMLTVAINEDRKVLGPGSVAVVLPEDAHGFENAGDAPATYYLFRYRSKAPVDRARGEQAGGSIMVDWNDLVMEETETGGRRQNFDRATAMFDRFEMHVSTLNEGLTNHAAHTHRAEEFVVIMKGDVQMQVGDAFYEASAGDIIFLASQIPHALNNTGRGQAEYFAFQWQ